jgi:hypothetical protein
MSPTSRMGFARYLEQHVHVPAPGAATLAMLRQDIAPQLAEVYPQCRGAVRRSGRTADRL